jgi:RHS repeat-associated protein
MKKLAQATTYRTRDDGTEEAQPTKFYFDGMGRPFMTEFPDHSKEWTFYSLGQIHQFITRKGQTKTINYDARGRETSNSWTGPAPALGVSRSWDDANRVLTLGNDVSTVRYQYDGAGLVLQESNDIAGAGGEVTTYYTRYPNGAIASYTFPYGGPLAVRGYNTRGQLTSTGTPGYTNWLTRAYLPDGKIDSQDYANGVHTAFGYDGRGMLKQETVTRSGQILADWTYYRDDRDRITSFQKGSNNAANPMQDGRGDHYWYDAEGQLTDAYYGAVDPVNSPHGQLRQEQFVYDQLGNRMGSQLLASRGTVAFSRDDNGLNQYRMWGAAPIQYEDDIGNGWGSAAQANGVQMFDGTTLAGFNSLNQPMYINTPSGGWISFGYDPLGRCVKRWAGLAPEAWTNPATYYYYDGWSLIQEGPSGMSPSYIYVRGGGVDEIVASVNFTQGRGAYHHYDGRGHCMFLTGNNDGAMMEQYEYAAFGKPYFFNAAGGTATSSSYGNRFLFTGREWLSELNIYDYRNRMYHPELGRFMQPDPKQFEAGDYNLYRYCHNDPVNKNDPTGLLEFEIKGDVYFTLKIQEQLQTIDSGPLGHSYLQELRDSPFKQIFVPSTDFKNGTTALNGAASENGTGSGSKYKIYPLSRLSGKDSQGNTTRPSFVGTGHEVVGHGIENKRGESVPTTSDKRSDKIPPSEKGAINRENEIRKEHNIPPRVEFERKTQ